VVAAPGLDWSVARMAALAGVGCSRLHALFVREFGLPPLAWVSAARLRWARRQLLCSDASISDIAQRAGYSEHSAFTRALRRESGRTPRQWRARQESRSRRGPPRCLHCAPFSRARVRQA